MLSIESWYLRASCVVLPAQMESSLQKLSAQERGVSSSGETLAQTEQALRDLESLESKAQVGPQTFHPNMFQKVPGCVSNRWSEILQIVLC